MHRLLTPIERRLRDASLGKKLTLAVELTGVAAILFAGLALFVYQAYSLRDQFRIEISTLTRMLATYAVGPVSFEDQRAMKEVLSGLQARDEVLHAELLISGRRLAVFDRAPDHDENLPAPAEGAVYDGWHLTCREPLALQGETIGHIVIHATFRPLFFAALRNFIPILLLVALVSLGGVMLITRFTVRLILGDLHQLTDSAARIASTSDYSVRATVRGSDEVGRLTATFNRMLDQLQAGDSSIRATNASLAAEIAERKRLQRALVTSSRLAGMAEVATGVLHNVGNVLNSVNVSAHLLRDRLEASRLRSLERTVELIAPHVDDPGPFFTSDPRGRLVPKFLGEIALQLAAERREQLAEIQALAANIEHIKEIVSTQQSYARTAGVNEQIDPVELLDDAVRINQTSLERHRVQLTRHDTPGLRLLTDRHRVLQILVNLISNAIHAVKPCPPENRRVELSIEVRPDRLAFVVRDHGVGIDPANLTRIFQHGFTTRPDGHGFGLHSGAIAARALGGAIDVASEGGGLGACFTLTIPPTPPSSAAKPENPASNPPFPASP